MTETSPERVARRAMFLLWAVTIAFGLIVMIALPLAGR